MAAPLDIKRSCGTCTLCCKFSEIAELKKPAHKWCQHCDIGKGCKIYSAKPSECSSFYCLWLYDERLPDDWRPDRIKCVLYGHIDGSVIADFEPLNRAALRNDKYLSVLRRYAAEIEHAGKFVVAAFGQNIFAVTPRQIFPLGRVRDSHQLKVNFDFTSRTIFEVTAVPNATDPSNSNE